MDPTPHSLSVSRTARYFVLGAPPDAARELWIVLHGYAQLANRFLGRFAAIATDGRAIVAPEALSRFYVGSDPAGHANAQVGASWMTRESREAEISDNVGYLDAVLGDLNRRMDARIVVLGFSQGAAAAARWIARGEVVADALILWSGGMPDDVLDAPGRAKLSRTSLTLVAGTEDQWIPEESITAALKQLEESGLKPEIVRFTGGHELEEGTLRELAAWGS